QGDKSRLCPVPVLGYDECAAVGGVAALLRAVVARMQGQLAGLRPRGDGNRTAARCELEVREPDRQERNQQQSGDPGGADGTLPPGSRGFGRSCLSLGLARNLE